MRQIVLDTETTGFSYNGDDRIIEIGCIEIIDLMPTGNFFHCYINPERTVPKVVEELTDLNYIFLSDKPLFKQIAKRLVDFIGDSEIIAHNADFDMNFINAELVSCGYPMTERSKWIDTIKIAKQVAPGAKKSLDALLKRFGISNEGRKYHTAIYDSLKLSQLYIELCGGKEYKIEFASQEPKNEFDYPVVKTKTKIIQLSDEQMSIHKSFAKNKKLLNWVY